MAFTVPEALWLASHRTSDDILVGYPTTDRAALAALAADEHAAATVTVMVDSPDHLDLIEKVSGEHPVRVCLDLDASYRALGGRVRVGARRSPVHTPDQAAALAREIVRRSGLTLVGIMAYESQIAGVGDDPPGRPARARAIRAMQARSRLELARRRAAVVQAVREVRPDLEFVNGGGTGSVEKTAAERAVTEVAAGSGLYHSALFDHYTNFSGRPAALFALPVVRRPGPGVVTCLGGGYLASGPVDKARLPQPYLPAGLSYDRGEGAGEVQTPLLGSAADRLGVGDRVWFRHAKAGELCERFATLWLLEGDQVVRSVPTYRGESKAFL
jgi:D-serine deaminase-like pyridoxal phosphate-dependent protein